MLKVFYFCIITCLVAYDSVGVIIIQFTYMRADVVTKLISFMSHSVAAIK